MRFHLRSPKDYGVDRPDMEAPQGVKSTGTNRPKQTHTKHAVHKQKKHTHFVRVHYAVSDTTPEHTRTQKFCCPESLSVVDSDRETPGPIPNPEAKPARADGTATGRLWESKLPPT